jgi:hypothetical protein
MGFFLKNTTLCSIKRPTLSHRANALRQTAVIWAHETPPPHPSYNDVVDGNSPTDNSTLLKIP